MRPGRGLITALTVWLLTAVVAIAWPGQAGWWVATGAAIAVAGIGLGVYLMWAAPTIRLARSVAPVAPIGEWTTVRLTLTSSVAATIHLFDGAPVSADLRGLPVRLALPAATQVEFEYHIRPRARGAIAFEPAEILIESVGDLVRRHRLVGEPQTLRVVPNFRPVLRTSLAGLEGQLSQLGVHLQRRRGDGIDFDELRDYQYGDSPRHVDWKATARLGRLISRHYNVERQQRVVLALDCGRRLHMREGDLSHLDHVLHGALLLTHIAAGHGDRVGMFAFGGVERYLEPVSGPGTLPQILDAVHDLESTPTAPDYLAAAARLDRLTRRRSLVVWLTNLRDEDTSDLLAALRLLGRRHVVVLASTRESSLRTSIDTPITDEDSARTVAAGHLYLRQRRQAHRSLTAAGAIVVDTEPEHLPVALASRYVEIKRAGRL